MSCKPEDKTRYAKLNENQTLSTDDSQKASGNSEIIPQSAKSKLKAKKMNKETREKVLTTFFFLAQLIPAGYHIVIYGAAGSGKTTVMLFLCKMIAKNHPRVEIYYLYLDGQLAMAAYYEEHLEKEGLADRYNIITEGSADEHLMLIEEMIENKEVDPANLIVVLDTLKFLNRNVLNKDANAKTMHRIKALTNKGVTFISLHHTNKDGENFAGTAEIEQDSDALLKIETTDGDDEHTKISTIKEGGRVRYHLKPHSFEFQKGDPLSVKMLDDEVDANKLLQEKQDAKYISIIKGILTLEGELQKSKLDSFLKEDDDFDLTDKERNRILKTYADRHWKITKGGKRKHIHYYSVIDTATDSIEKIAQKL